MADDKNEINLENLEQVTGGASSRPAGITCPECGGFIPVSMEQFNTIGSIICPCCGNKNEDEIIRVRRITGYLTGSPKKTIFKSWNDGKLAELRDRHNI